jgi:hypothetical protein
MAWKLIRVLDDEGRAVGPWAPKVEPADLRRGLRAMLRTRAFDARMLIAQRQKKISFYMQCAGRRSDRGRARAGAAAGRHVLPHLPPAGPAAVPRRHRRWSS